LHAETGRGDGGIEEFANADEDNAEGDESGENSRDRPDFQWAVQDDWCVVRALVLASMR
jgi:hypothetical protein